MRAHAGAPPPFPRTRRMKRLSHRENSLTVSPMRGVRRSGPCIMGGVSPSWYHAWQCVTGPVFTGPALPQMSGSQCGFLEPKPDIWGVPASSGPVQSEDLTKACQRAPLSCPSIRQPLHRRTHGAAPFGAHCAAASFPRKRESMPAKNSTSACNCHGLPFSRERRRSQHSNAGTCTTGALSSKSLSVREKAYMVSPMRGVRRSGPCITGGVSPSWYHAWQSVTGPVFTGPASPPYAVSLYGFLEPQTAYGGRPASSGPAQSGDLTKACRRAPLPCSSASSPEARP